MNVLRLPGKLCGSLVVALAAMSLLAAPGAAKTRGLRVDVRASEIPGAPVAESVELYRSSHALVIGIDKYRRGWPQLRMAVRDAREVAKEFARRGFDVTFRTNLDAVELRETLREFFAIKGADPEARLVLWFAGHGHSIGREGYLVPADAPRPNDRRFLLKAIHMRDFAGLVRLARAKHVLSIFDSCFSGTIFTSRSGAASAAITRKTTLPVRQFLTSGDAGQQVRDDGSFRKLFLRAIRGEERADFNDDGYVTGEELGLFLSQRMEQLTSAAQTPRHGKLQDVDYDRGDFVFRLARRTPGRPAEFASSIARSRRAVELAFWNSISASEHAADYQAYLEKYPSGEFTRLAQIRLERLGGTMTATMGDTQSRFDTPSDTAIAEVQRRLTALGFTTGPADGYMGRQTREAIRQFQRLVGLPATGEVSESLLASLRKEKPRRVAGAARRPMAARRPIPPPNPRKEKPPSAAVVAPVRVKTPVKTPGPVQSASLPKEEPPKTADATPVGIVPDHPPGSYTPLPVGTVLDYGAWKCRVIRTKGFETVCQGDPGQQANLYGLFVPFGLLPEGAYAGVVSEAFCDGDSRAGLLGGEIGPIDLDIAARRKIEGIWPLKVGNSAIFEINSPIGVAKAEMRVDRTERVEIGGTWRETHIIVQTVVLPQFDVFGDYNLPCNASYKRTIWYDDKLASIVKEEFEWLTGGIVGLWNTYALVNARPSPNQPPVAKSSAGQAGK